MPSSEYLAIKGQELGAEVCGDRKNTQFGRGTWVGSEIQTERDTELLAGCPEIKGMRGKVHWQKHGGVERLGPGWVPLGAWAGRC